jgi:putative ABC transport system permease protein
MDTFGADLRSAARSLRRTPGFSALAIATIAVSIGLTTALYSLVDAVVFRPLPYVEPHRLVEIWGRDDRRTGMRVPGVVLEALRARATTLHVIGTHDPTAGVLQTAEGLVDIRGETVSATLVEVFGVHPLVGRGFVAEDERQGAAAVMLVSFTFWQRYLAGAADAVGHVVYLDEVPYTVVGVMPPEFATAFLASPPEFWTPYAGNRSRDRERELGYELVARLAPHVTIEQASRQVESIASSLDVEAWRNTGRRIGMTALKDEVVRDSGDALQLLLAAVGVLLAIACANLAQLLLARSDRRVIEFATRKAIGAGSGSVFRLALCESLLLSILGATLGVLLAHQLIPAMSALAPTEIPRLADARLSGRVLAMAIVVTAMTGIAFGLAPALRLARLSVIDAMKPTTATAPAPARVRSALVVVQVACAVTLTVLAGLVVQTFLTLLPASPGFATASRATFVWSLREDSLPVAADRRERVRQWMTRLAATPLVRSVAVASSIPFGDDDARNVPIRRADDSTPIDEDTMRTELRAVSENFLSLLEIPLIQGRQFDAGDTAEAPRVAIVNQRLARRLDSRSGALGQVVRIGSSPASPVYRIVGVAADTRWTGATLEVLNEVYTPFAQDRASFGFLIVESTLDVAALTRSIRSEMSAVLPGASLPAARRAVMLDELLGRSVAGPRFSATLFGAFSAIAFGLSLIGLFGLVMYSVSQRRREFGIRTALGAPPRALVMTAVGGAMLLTSLGISLGLGSSIWLTRFVENQLYAIGPFDGPTFAGAAIAMLTAATIAAYIPARRAVRTDPMTSLRCE